jgi:hypothetical protein
MSLQQEHYQPSDFFAHFYVWESGCGLVFKVPGPGVLTGGPRNVIYIEFSRNQMFFPKEGQGLTHFHLLH